MYRLQGKGIRYGDEAGNEAQGALRHAKRAVGAVDARQRAEDARQRADEAMAKDAGAASTWAEMRQRACDAWSAVDAAQAEYSAAQTLANVSEGLRATYKADIEAKEVLACDAANDARNASRISKNAQTRAAQLLEQAERAEELALSMAEDAREISTKTETEGRPPHSAPDEGEARDADKAPDVLATLILHEAATFYANGAKVTFDGWVQDFLNKSNVRTSHMSPVEALTKALVKIESARADLHNKILGQREIEMGGASRRVLTVSDAVVSDWRDEIEVTRVAPPKRADSGNVIQKAPSPTTGWHRDELAKVLANAFKKAHAGERGFTIEVPEAASADLTARNTIKAVKSTINWLNKARDSPFLSGLLSTTSGNYTTSMYSAIDGREVEGEWVAYTPAERALADEIIAPGADPLKYVIVYLEETKRRASEAEATKYDPNTRQSRVFFDHAVNGIRQSLAPYGQTFEHKQEKLARLIYDLGARLSEAERIDAEQPASGRSRRIADWYSACLSARENMGENS